MDEIVSCHSNLEKRLVENDIPSRERELYENVYIELTYAINNLLPIDKMVTANLDIVSDISK